MHVTHANGEKLTARKSRSLNRKFQVSKAPKINKKLSLFCWERSTVCGTFGMGGLQNPQNPLKDENYSALRAVRPSQRAIRSLERIVERLPWCSSGCLSVYLGRGMHCDDTVHLARIWVYGCIVQYSGHPDTKACPPTPRRLFQTLPERDVGMDVQTIGVISQDKA